MSTPAIDDLTAWAITAVPHHDDQSAQRWLEVLHTAWTAWQEEGESCDWNALAQAIRTTAESMGTWDVEYFLSTAEGTGQGVDLIQRLVLLDSDLPQLYWRLGPMAWVRDGLDTRAEAWFGAAWSTALMAYLNDNVPDWQQWADEDKAVWLADLFTQWEHQPAAEPVAHAADAKSGPSRDLESAAAEAVAAAVADIPGAEELTTAELRQIRDELVAEFTPLATVRGV